MDAQQFGFSLELHFVAFDSLFGGGMVCVY
jgi:hypothetical protein